jgi:hypothetical protein
VLKCVDDDRKMPMGNLGTCYIKVCTKYRKMGWRMTSSGSHDRHPPAAMT